MEAATRQIRYEASNLWLYLLGGSLLLWLGFVAFQNPVSAYLGLSLYFAATIFVNGLVGAVFALSNRASIRGWGWVATTGVLEALLGLYLLVAPGLAASALAFVIGFWLVYRSITAITNAFMLRQLGAKGLGWVLVAGMLGLGLSFVVLANPLVGAAGAAIWLALGLVMLGIACIVLAFQLRGTRQLVGAS